MQQTLELDFDPSMDGVTHVNVYSKGKTSLGRWLSNFTHEPIETEDGPFNSIEGYWYWLGCRHDRLRVLSGFAAKQFGRECEKAVVLGPLEFRAKVCRAIRVKALQRPDMLAELRANQLPLAHYYVFNNKVKPAGGEWILDCWRAVARDHVET